MMADKGFTANVQWWDSWTVHVQCPFCRKIHKHFFGQSYESVHRVAQCDSSPPLPFPSYQFKFPFSEKLDTSAFEIDKSSKRYIAIDADRPQPRPDLLEEALSNLVLNGKPAVALESFKDAVETITVEKTDTMFRRLHKLFAGDETFTLKRIEHVLSDMIHFGDQDYVREYLDSSPESGIFLHGVDNDGESALSYAACERSPAIVKLLLDRGANANFQNKDGRTPLMQAALWGRYESVRHLLRYGADKNLQDRDGFKAIQLAGLSDRNEEERYWRSGRKNQIYREVTQTANQARRMIAHLLKDDDDQTVLGSNDNFEHHVFRKLSRGTITLFAPIAEYPISNEYKTIARLERGHKYPSVAAMSGWGHRDTTAIISGRDWTSEAIQMAGILGHDLKTVGIKDQGIPGQFHACHAEKQLIAYFISKHVFIETEIRAPPEKRVYPVNLLAKKDIDERFSIKAGPESDKRGSLHQLATILPPVMLKKAKILVSCPPCEDCTEFTKLVNLKLGLSISLLTCFERG